MKFYEFGKVNSTTLLLIHGMSTTWEMSFKRLIEFAQKEFHIIAVALDGHNPEEQTELDSLQEEAHKIEEYLSDNGYKEIDVVYGSSLGGAILFHLLILKKVNIKTAICDGTMLLNYGILAKPMAKFMASTSAKMAKGEAKFMMKLMGIESKEILEQKMYTGATEKTIYNSCMGCYSAKLPADYSDTAAIHLWYGSKETEPPKFAAKMKKRDNRINVRVFDGYGHGGLLEYPEMLLCEIKKCCFCGRNNQEKL